MSTVLSMEREARKKKLYCVIYLYGFKFSSEFSSYFIVGYSLKITGACAGHVHVPARNGMFLTLSKYCASG